MSEIKFKNKLILFDRIVAYGCSFTAGGELADHLLMPGKTVDEVDKIKKKLGQEQFNYIPEVINNGSGRWSNHHGKTLSWASKLANKFNVPILNNSVGGSSMQSVIYLIEQDMTNNVINLESDLILVGITGPDRWMYFDNSGTWRRPGSQYISTDWPSKKFYKEFTLHMANDYNFFYNWYTSIKYIDMLSSHLGGRILQQPCLTRYKDHEYDISKLTIKSIIEKINIFDSIIDHDHSLWDMMEDKSDTHAWHHPKEIYHQRFADHLFEILKYE